MKSVNEVILISVTPKFHSIENKECFHLELKLEKRENDKEKMDQWKE